MYRPRIAIVDDDIEIVSLLCQVFDCSGVPVRDNWPDDIDRDGVEIVAKPFALDHLLAAARSVNPGTRGPYLVAS